MQLPLYPLIRFTSGQWVPITLRVKKGERIVGHRTVHESLAFPEIQRLWKKKVRKAYYVCTTS